MDHDRERARSFARVADAYHAARPHYPEAAIDWVLAGAPGPRVLDLAAGTGKLTESLVRRPGLVVAAVEPLDEMRAFLQAGLPQVRALRGTAEEIPLADASMDAVVVGQAFHWFDQPAALGEIARVLSPAGVLGLLWNMRDDAEPWVRAFSLATRGAGDTASQGTDRESAALAADPRFRRMEARSFPHVEPFDRERLVAFARSTSGVASLPDGERNEVLEAVRRLPDQHPDLRGRARFGLPYRTDAVRAVRTGD